MITPRPDDADRMARREDDSDTLHTKTPESQTGPPAAPVAGLLSQDEEAEPHGQPIFYDARHRRWPWFIRFTGLALLVFLVAVGVLIVSVLALPLMPYNKLPRATVVRDTGNLDPIATLRNDRQRRQLSAKLTHEKSSLDRLGQKVNEKKEERLKRANRFLVATKSRKPVLSAAQLLSPKGVHSVLPASVPKNVPPVVTAFYVNWEQSSLASAELNAKYLTHFIPEWLHLEAMGTNFANPTTVGFLDAREAQDRATLTPLVRSHSTPILPLINNYTSSPGAEAGVGRWDTAAVHDLISSPRARANFIKHLSDWLLLNQMQGVNIDFEEVASQDRSALVEFMKELYAVLHPQGLLVTQDVQVENDSYDLKGLAQWNDWIVPMFYDQHAGGTGPGPVAGLDWVQRNLDQMLKQVPPGKIVMGIANQAYNWVSQPGRTDALSLGYEEAILSARESYPDAKISLAPGSLNPTYTYTEDSVDPGGQKREEPHVVWMLDAVTAYNQLLVSRPKGIRGAALWMMGEEDPSIWTFYNRDAWDKDWSKLDILGSLSHISYSGTGQIDFDGEGELLQPIAEPSVGVRALDLDPKTRQIVQETYQVDANGRLTVPTSWVVRRYGGTNNNNKRQILLTFDDGPDPEWTPQILAILKQYQIPALFFVTGRNAESYPGLVQQEWENGYLVGNHTWNHPDLAELSPEHQRFELTSTQRIIEAITNHSTTLFRPPYGNDVEPQTGKEVRPLDLASSMNYITVGQKNDPQDWRTHENKPGTETQDPARPRSVQSIVDSVIVNRNVGSIVLFHDAGGDRSRTVAALPQIIERLKAMGYQFVGLDQLSGISRDRLMPKLTGRDIVLGGADRYIFEVHYWFQRILTTLFLLSIYLGVSRVLLFLVLALIQRHREKQRVFPGGYTPSVSVVIAAYNEEKVIAQTVTALLRSGYPHLEVIVVDDGSKDRTADVVREQFSTEPRVQVIRKPNGGKASALNRGISVATGEIVVSLDADTLFAQDTIERLARHFQDPNVGAVSGNVRVGNIRNIFTRWQALEYVTSQNFDRRGYDLLNCITVVPGAVGAMRRDAVLAVGGYSRDTLAEDTDLTWKLRRGGWRITNDNSAMAYTEAPETLHSLAKQRFRWAFGTLQCLWKHRAALFNHGAFGWVALPSLWIYQILFPAISPFMDAGMIYSLFEGNFLLFAQLFLLMFSIEFVAAFIALRMDQGNLRLLPYLLLQRFVYRQLMYYVVLKSIVAAIRGGAVGWGKLERTGSARIEGKPAA